jgi:hypothetical protein
MTKIHRREVGGLRLSLSVPVLLIAAALAVVTAGCQGLAAAAALIQGSELSALAVDEAAPFDPAPAASTVDPTAEPTDIAAPSAEATEPGTPAPESLATSSPETEPASTPAPKSVAGSAASQLAPDLTLPDLHGNEVTLSDLRGKVVLLNFWATW